MNKVPFHIISGFLGSGKTTFLKRAIDKYAGELRIGVIQNEFAPANIDGEELTQTGKDFKLLEINNGSVFCVCLLGSFVRSLEEFIDEVKPDIILMEASGLSDTTSVSEIVSAGQIGEKIFLAANWCVVDALNFEKAGMMKQRVIHQLRMADIIVINKTDLLTGSVDELKNELAKVNPFAEITESVFCDIGFELGSLPREKFYFDQVEPMGRPEINSIVLKSSRKLSRPALEEFLARWAPRAFRIKGFVNLKNGETLAVQCTFNNVALEPVRQSYHPTELVVMTTEFTHKEFNHSFREYSKV